MTNPSDSPRGEIAPAVVLIGDLVMKVLEYAKHLDFLLSVRDEKLATILQIYRDFGWWVVGGGAAFWLYYEYKRRQRDSSAHGSVGSLVASVAFVSFLFGCLITVRATGSPPNFFMAYGGRRDPIRPTCFATVDTSSLAGFADDYRLIMICGVVDASVDAMDDTQISVSSPFYISVNGSGAATKDMVVPIDKLVEYARKENPQPPGQLRPGQEQAVSFQMWHMLALIPKEVQSDSIKKPADVGQLGGRILTMPPSAWASPMEIDFPAAQPGHKQ